MAAAVGIAALPTLASGANLYWDTDGAGAGGATAPGTWDTTSSNWSTSAAGTVATGTWGSAGSTAVFAAGTNVTGAYAVTVDGTQSTDGIRFEDGTVTIASGTLNLTSNGIVVGATGAANDSAINSVITGAVGINLSRVGTVGTPTLALGGDNTYSGATTIVVGANAAILQLTLNHNNALGATGAGNGTAFASTGSQSAFIALPGDRIIAEDITITGGATSGIANGQLRATAGVNTWSGNILMNGTVNSLGTGLAGIGASAGTLVITGIISNLATAGANTAGTTWGKTGAGTLVLRSPNSNKSFTRVFNGILEVQCDGALGTPTVDGTFDGSTVMTSQSNSSPTLAFSAPPASSGFSYNVHEIITTSGLPVASGGTGLGMSGNSMIDNFGGDNTFSGFLRMGGPQASGPTRILTSLGARTGTSLELSGGLFSSNSGAGTNPPATPTDTREIHKIGGGNLIISGANDTVDGVTSGDSDLYRLHGNFIIDAGTLTLRSTNASGGVFLGNTIGPMNFTANAGATLALDNSLAANGNRIASNAVVTVAGGEFKLVGNAATSITQTLANPSIGGNATLTITQPAGSATTTLRIAPSGALNTSRVSTLSISTDAKLDLTDNKLIVAAGDIGSWNGSAYTGVKGQIQSGLGDGSWNGAGGLVTSMTDATTSVLTTLAVALAEEVGYDGGTFGGVSVGSGDVLVMYTWGGDANLDGQLNGDDYFRIDSHALQSGSVFGFHNGDFNYDGEINGEDYFIIDSNYIYALNSAPFPTGAGASLAAVPEPAAVAFLMTPLLLLRRRRDC